MSVATAKNNYLGTGGCQRMNCAQSVASAFKEKFGIEDNLIDLMKNYGGGRAPSGLCGAFYAAKYLGEKYDKEKTLGFEEYFLEHAGALECGNIKNLKKLSCVGCVEKSSEFLENIQNKG